MCATCGWLLVPVITYVFALHMILFIFLLLVDLISHHQPIEVNVKAVLFYMMAGTLLSCLAHWKHTVDSGLICEPGLSGL